MASQRAEQWFKELQSNRNRSTKVLQEPHMRGVWKFVKDTYSDQAHFIYELLQNADDAKATTCKFILSEDGLTFIHNGQVHFTVSDPKNEDIDKSKGQLGHINSITSIGNTSKTESEIGKFGVGFKAVFLYTSTPYIYDDQFKFLITDYILPQKIHHDHPLRKTGETLFYFPFDLPEKPREEAHEDISNKLRSLTLPILFLDHLKQLDWETEEEKGSYSKSSIENFLVNDIICERLIFHRIKKGEDDPENLWLFSNRIKLNSEDGFHKYTVGYFLTKDHKIDLSRSYDAFCYFPTKENTGLKFIIHAPFLLTNNREGVKAGDDWNLKLVSDLASLAANSLTILKDIGVWQNKKLIDDSLLDLIPYDPNVFSEQDNRNKISFKPFYNEILKVLKSQVILPGTGIKYYNSDHAFWPADPDLTDIFNDQQISEILDHPESGWVFISKSKKRVQSSNYALANYIEKITREDIDAKKILRRMDEKFIENQTNDWLFAFYQYLLDRSYLWDDLKYKPHILNQHRKAVAPFDQHLKTLKIFFPGEHRTSFDTIHPELYANDVCRKYLVNIGIQKPDLRDEIYLTILPQYDDEFNYEDDDTIKIHFLNFLEYYEQSNLANQEELIKRLRNIDFLPSVRESEPSKIYFSKPDEIYIKSPELIQYFNDPEVLYFYDEYYSEIITEDNKHIFTRFLQALGVKNRPELKINNLEITDEVKSIFDLHEIEVSPSSYYSQIIADRELDGLDNAITHINLDISIYIWKTILELIGQKTIEEVTEDFSGYFIYKAPRKHYANTHVFESSFLKSLKEKKWLFDHNEELKAASELTRKDLHFSYEVSGHSAEILLQVLGILSVNVDQILNEKEKKWLRLGKLLEASGADENELKDFLHWKSIHKHSQTQQSLDPNFEEGQAEEIIKQFKEAETFSDSSKEKKAHDKKENGTTSQELKESFKKQEKEIEEDEYIKPAVNYDNKIEQLKNETANEIANFEKLKVLTEKVNQSEKYSFGWIKALLELEIINGAESYSRNQQITLQFTKVEKEPGTEKTIILRHPDRYIPQSIEDIGDLAIKIQMPDQVKTIAVEVVNIKDYTLRAKLKSYSDINNIDLEKVTLAIVDIKNPIFILEELSRSFEKLALDDDYNMRDHLTSLIKFIFGPPGTGKTTYLAKDIIMPLMKEQDDLKILVLTPTNKAADVLTSRLITEMGKDESYCDWLLRFGVTGDYKIEESGLLIDKSYDIEGKEKFTLITTIARFPYDLFVSDSGLRISIKDIPWDYIIIDEASMIPLASILYPIYYKTDCRFIIAGDPFQIPPITALEPWKDENIYTLVNLTKFIDPRTIPHNYEIINLLTQYRSIPTIGELFSHFTYNGVLRHARTLDDQKTIKLNGLQLADINIVRFPVIPFESIYKSRRLKNTPYHIYSAIFTVEFAQYLIKEISTNYDDIFKIGIITPYRAQASLIEKLLSQKNLDSYHTDFQVGTIHGFQGDECDLIITVFNPPPTICSSPDMFLNKQNILNVSISRAKDYLIILTPDLNTEKRDLLFKINRIEELVEELVTNRHLVFESEEIEEIIFGEKSYIYNNSFATTHQWVNVYSIPENRYEIRCEENAIDVQIKLTK